MDSGLPLNFTVLPHLHYEVKKKESPKIGTGLCGVSTAKRDSGLSVFPGSFINS